MPVFENSLYIVLYIVLKYPNSKCNSGIVIIGVEVQLQILFYFVVLLPEGTQFSQFLKFTPKFLKYHF